MFTETRRFIAGARCPNCQCEDRTVVYHREGQDHRECVACGWLEAAPQSNGPVSDSQYHREHDRVRWAEPPGAKGSG